MVERPEQVRGSVAEPEGSAVGAAAPLPPVLPPPPPPPPRPRTVAGASVPAAPRGGGTGGAPVATFTSDSDRSVHVLDSEEVEEEVEVNSVEMHLNGDGLEGAGDGTLSGVAGDLPGSGASAGTGRSRGGEEPLRTRSRGRARGQARADASGEIHMPGGLRLTDRDYQLLTFLARYRLATIAQIARQFHTSESALRNRLPRLEKAGLLAWAYTGQTKPKVWTVTDTGLKVAGIHLKAPQISWGTLRHTLGLVDLGVTFEQAGELVVTEREIRAAATRDTPTARMRTALTLTNPHSSEDTPVDVSTDTTRHYLLPTPGKSWGHIPDMVLVRQPFDNGAAGNIAIELELTRKTLFDWKNILTAYRDTPQFAQTIYYTTDPDVQRPLTGAIEALNAHDRIQVIPFTPIETAATPTHT